LFLFIFFAFSRRVFLFSNPFKRPAVRRKDEPLEAHRLVVRRSARGLAWRGAAVAPGRSLGLLRGALVGAHVGLSGRRRGLTEQPKGEVKRTRPWEKRRAKEEEEEEEEEKRGRPPLLRALDG
jgi:hypothetical protein